MLNVLSLKLELQVFANTAKFEFRGFCGESDTKKTNQCFNTQVLSLEVVDNRFHCGGGLRQNPHQGGFLSWNRVWKFCRQVHRVLVPLWAALVLPLEELLGPEQDTAILIRFPT